MTRILTAGCWSLQGPQRHRKKARLAGFVPICQEVGGHCTLHPESINTLVQKAVTRAGMDAGAYSAHGLRAGFVAYAHLRGASDRARPPDAPPLASDVGYLRPRPASMD
jgi:hypothetical protein